jgi:hypothetical protein
MLLRNKRLVEVYCELGRACRSAICLLGPSVCLIGATGVVLQVGFGVAVEHCIQQDLPACWQRTQQLASQLRQRLSAEVPGLTLQDRGRVLCGIVSFTLASHADAAEVKSWLAAQTQPINVSLGTKRTNAHVLSNETQAEPQWLST